MYRRIHAASPTALEHLEPRVLLDSSAALDQTVFYPEGYAHDQVSEIVIIANQGSIDAEYELWARYETGERDQILASGIIEAGHRQDITLTAAGGAAGRVVRSDTPFSLELKASEPLTATFDFTFTNGQVVHETKTLASHEVEDVDARLQLAPGIALELGYTVTVRSSGPIVASLEHWEPPHPGRVRDVRDPLWHDCQPRQFSDALT